MVFAYRVDEKEKNGGIRFRKASGAGGMLLYFEPFLLVSSTITRPGLGRECRVTFSELWYAVEWSYVAGQVRATLRAPAYCKGPD
jgi:hypothetical protein